MRCILLILLSLSVYGKDTVKLTFLANEGAMLQAQGKTVVIDAFVIEPYSIYNTLSQETWKAMIQKEPPFEKVDLALVSHRHLDHFQPKAAIVFLQAHPETQLLSSKDVTDLLAKEPGYAEVKDRIQTRLPKVGEVLTWQDGPLSVDFLRIPHGGQRWKDLHNLGHVIRFGDRSILHIGDAVTTHSAYEIYASQIKDLDVALIPYWFYGSKTGLKLIQDIFKAKSEVAVHISRDDTQSVRESWPTKHPGVIVYGAEGSSVVLP